MAESLGLQALIVNLFDGQRPFEQTGDRLFPFDVKQRKTRVAGMRVTVGKRARRRAIADGEILQPAVAVQADAARANPAERHAGLEQLAMLEGKEWFGSFHGGCYCLADLKMKERRCCLGGGATVWHLPASLVSLEESQSLQAGSIIAG